VAAQVRARVHVALTKFERWCLSLGAAYTLGLGVFAFRFSTFVGDDLSAFWLIRTQPFSAYLTALLGGQLVILHRASTALLYWLAPMRFGLAVAVMTALQLTTALFLFRLLDLLEASRVNAPLVTYYMLGAFAVLQFAWWSSGLTRLAYLALTSIALFRYVRFLREGARQDLFAVAVAYGLSLGFYSKGILTPFYCLALELVLSRKGHVDARRLRIARTLLVGLVLAGALYGKVAHALLPEAQGRLNLDVPFLCSFVLRCWMVLAASLFGLVVGPGTSGAAVPVLLIAGAGLWCALRWRSTALPLGCLVVLITANFLLMGVSNRTLLFGDSVAFQYRHYFELSFTVVLFTGIALQNVAGRGDVALTEKRRRLAASGTALALCCFALLSMTGIRGLLRGPADEEAFKSIDRLELFFYRSMPNSRRFLLNLRSDLAKLAEEGVSRPKFADGVFPVALDPLDFSFRRYSQLFVVLNEQAEFPPSGVGAIYRVNDDGHVVPNIR
jgi:hypothetical protein